METKICPYCGTEFDVTRPTKKFCSKKCKNNNSRDLWYSRNPSKKEEQLKKFASKHYRRKKIKEYKSTDLERQLYSFLNAFGIEYVKQYNLNFTRPDAFIPKLNLCVYADGEYWHNINDTKNKDLVIVNKLTNLGFNVIRLDELKGILILKPLLDLIYQERQG